MQFTAYLSFQGECAQAFAAYAEIFDGEVRLHRFDEMPAGTQMPALPPEQADWIMHAELELPDGGRLMGADMPAQFGGVPMAGVSVAVTLPDAQTARAIFERLVPGGKARMEFGPTFFSPGFGMLTDRFGTSWMVMTAEAA